MRICTATAIAVILAIIACYNFPASAQQLTVSEDELILKARYIVVGEVIDKQSHWNQDHSLIVTDFKISVLDQLSPDSLGSETTVTVLGGEVGDVGLFVTHQPCLELGERALLFLVETSGDRRETLYGDQGKMELSGDIIVNSGQSLQTLKNKIINSNSDKR